jgi:hypothetical protein
VWAGTTLHPFEDPNRTWSYIPFTQWTKSLLKDLQITGTSLRLYSIPRQTDDRLLMYLVLNHSPPFRNYEITRFNLCCIYYQALWLSEICSEDGKSIIEAAWNLNAPSTKQGGDYQFLTAELINK